MHQTQLLHYWNRKEISERYRYERSLLCRCCISCKTDRIRISAVIPTTNALLSILNTFFEASMYGSPPSPCLLLPLVKNRWKICPVLRRSVLISSICSCLLSCSASICQIITETPLLLFSPESWCCPICCSALYLVNCFHFDLEDIILASNANIGGPTTAAGMAIFPRMDQAGRPVMLIGTFGYVIGTYLGVVVGGLLAA